jgi:outer membrane protein assembly factor BamB
MTSHPLRSVLAALAAALLTAAAATAEDWPRWRGLRRDGISRDTGLIKSWPATGPKVLWKHDLTGGYSAPVIARGRLIIQTEDQKEEIVRCLDPVSGKQLWEYRYPADYDQHPTLDQRFKGGPRSTPAIDGDRVYAIGTAGILNCLDVKSGKPIWQADLLKMADRTCPDFGYTGSPLIEGNLVFVHPGGQKGNSIAALDKRDGKVVWQSLDDRIGYSTPILIPGNGKQQQLVHFTAVGVVAVSPATGQPLWRYDWKTDFDLNVATPIFHEGKLFISSNYGHGNALLKLRDGAEPEQVYKSLVMQNHYSTSVLHQGHLYGFSNDRLRCMDFETGAMKWDQRGLGRGSVLIADGQLILLGDKGDLVLADLSPEAYTERARWKPLEGQTWTAPVLANGILYLRNETTLLAVDMKKTP